MKYPIEVTFTHRDARTYSLRERGPAKARRTIEKHGMRCPDPEHCHVAVRDHRQTEREQCACGGWACPFCGTRGLA